MESSNHAAMMLEALSVHYCAWLRQQGLPQRCANELLMTNPELKGGQVKWLYQFVTAWNAIEEMAGLEQD